MAHVKDPQRFARERLWEKFNERAGSYTKFVTDCDPERTQLFLENSQEMQVEAWMSDFENNVSVLYKMRDDTWLLYTRWREVDDPEISGHIAYAAVSSSNFNSLAWAVAFLESSGEGEATWFASLGRDNE